MAGKTFPAFPANALTTGLRIWQEAHGPGLSSCILGIQHSQLKCNRNAFWSGYKTVDTACGLVTKWGGHKMIIIKSRYNSHNELWCVYYRRLGKWQCQRGLEYNSVRPTNETPYAPLVNPFVLYVRPEVFHDVSLMYDLYSSGICLIYDKYSSGISLTYKPLRTSSAVFVHRVEASSPTMIWRQNVVSCNDLVHIGNNYHGANALTHCGRVTHMGIRK